MENKNETSNQDFNSALHKTDVSGSSNFVVECNVCKQHYENWTGSTPCCGSIAYMVEDGKATTKISLFASINKNPIEPTTIDLGSLLLP